MTINCPSYDGRLLFERETHRFSIGDQWLPSVSQLVKRYCKEFDQDYWSRWIARKRGITQAEVLAEWEAKAEASRKLGTAVHGAIERALYGRELPMLEPDAWSRFETWFLKVSHRFIEPAAINGISAIELPVWHQEFQYAGIEDLLADTSDGPWIFDWKTNGAFTEHNKYGDRLLAPFTDLHDCDFTIYSIQTSLYRMAWESHGVQTNGAAIVWLGPNGQLKLRKALDLRSRLTADLASAAPAPT